MDNKVSFEDILNISSNNIITKSEKLLDIVYTFVDTDDMDWRNKVLRYGIKPSGIRYDKSHILFSLQSLQKYCDHDIINNIYIVSDNQRFDLSSIRTIAHKIRWIDHKQIIPNPYLPTFNSMVIEAFLWNIPNLLEHFLYFNDDIIVGRKINYNTFFNKNDQPIQFYYKSDKEYVGGWNGNLYQSNLLFKDQFPSYEGLLYPQHSVYHLQKTHFKSAYDIFEKKLIHMFTEYKFRNYHHAHNLIFLTGMYMDYCQLIVNRSSSFKHIFHFTPELVESTIKNRKSFYAIGSSISSKKEKEYYQKFQNLILTNISCTNVKNL